MEEEILAQAVMRLMDGANLPFLLSFLLFSFLFFALIRFGVS